MESNKTIQSGAHEFRRRTDADRTGVRESEAEFTVVLELAGLGMFDYYPLSGELFWSAAARECFGLSPDAAVNYNVFLAGFHAGDRKRIVEALQRALRREDQGRLSVEFRTIGIEDGKERRIAMRGQVFFNQWGKAARLLATTQDITERRVEIGPRQAGDLFRRVFDNVYDGILLHAADGSIVDMNDRFLAMYRVGREQLRKMSITHISAPSNPLEDLPRIWSRVMAGEHQLFEWKAKRPLDQSIFDVEIFLTRMDMRGGALILATVRDISDRKRLEESLRLSEERYKLLFDKSPLPKWVFDMETLKLLEVNDAAVDHYGYSREEFLGLTLGEIRTPEEFEKLLTWVRTCCTRGERFEGQVQTRHRTKDGREYDVDVRYTEIVYNGRRAGLGTAIDITERKRVEEAVKRSRTLLAEAENLSHTGAWEWDVVADTWTFSDEWLKIHGTEGKNLSPDELIVIAHPDDRPMIQKAFEGVRSGVRPYEIEHRIIRKDTGETRVVRARGQFVRDPAGTVVRVYGFVQDITERKQAEQEQERLITELQRSNNELQQFAYVASHDLQEPLRTVASFSELLAGRYKGKLDATADRYISFIVEGANRMSALINDLLAFARIGTRGSALQRVSMDAVVDRVLADLCGAARESGAAVTKETLPEVVGDESQLKQLLLNLLANAIKFRKKDQRSEIRISADRKEGQWVFAVKDNGIGIEPRFFERIFTIFQRLHTRDEYPGTGVGLAICRRIVERHGGRIWVESKPGEGSTFFFTLRDADETRNER